MFLSISLCLSCVVSNKCVYVCLMCGACLSIQNECSFAVLVHRAFLSDRALKGTSIGWGMLRKLCLMINTYIGVHFIYMLEALSVCLGRPMAYLSHNEAIP